MTTLQQYNPPRQHPRVTPVAEVQGSVRGGVDVRVLNLSPGGALIEHAEPVAPGGTRILFLRLHGQDLWLRAHVAWSQVHRRETKPPDAPRLIYRSGLHFRELAPATELELRRYLGLSLAPTA